MDTKHTVANLKFIRIYLSRSLHFLFLQQSEQRVRHRGFLEGTLLI